jgi:chemotaxis response regulator CheB
VRSKALQWRSSLKARVTVGMPKEAVKRGGVEKTLALSTIGAEITLLPP